jgi:signal transduction histidine kinase
MNDAYEELKKRYDRLNLLYQVSQIVHSTLDPHKALDLVLGEAVRLMGASSGTLVLVNPTTGFLEIQAAQGHVPKANMLRLRVGEGITGWVVRNSKPALVGDVAKDARYIELRPHVRSELAVPLEVRGEVRGALNVDSDRLNAFTDEDQELLQELARQAASVIQNTWLHEQIRNKAQLFETLVRVGQSINSTLRLDEALKAITREACTLMNTKMCSLLLLDEQQKWLDLRASFGAGPAYVSKPRLNVDESLVGVVVRRRKALQVENVQVSSRYQNIEIARREGLVSLLSVPMVHGSHSIGALSVYTGEPHVFSNQEIQILSALSELSALAIEKARLYERLVDMEEQLRQNEQLSALGLLAAEVAHEIRNPLTVMKMLFHSMDLQFPQSDPRSRDVKIMGEKMDQLNRIVERVLDFARGNEPQMAPLSVNQLMDDLSLLIRHKLAQHQIQLECHLEADLPAIVGDATQMEQVFLNLALNALEAMPEGGVLAISTRKSKKQLPDSDGDSVEIEFKDTGHGMTREQQKRIFTSVLNTTKRNGTGLGLAIVGKIIETHHGHIEVKSRPGRGATFVITLPAAG